MNVRHFLVSVSIALSALGAAAYADSAKADDASNPYLPKPAASTVGSYGPYCSIRPLGPLWSCEAPDMSSNGYGEGDKLGLPDREGKHIVHEVKKI